MTCPPILSPAINIFPAIALIRDGYRYKDRRKSGTKDRITDKTVSGKSSMSYFAAHANERKETRQLHTRFPKQLKKAVLTAVQFRESLLSPSASPPLALV